MSLTVRRKEANEQLADQMRVLVAMLVRSSPYAAPFLHGTDSGGVPWLVRFRYGGSLADATMLTENIDQLAVHVRQALLYATLEHTDDVCNSSSAATDAADYSTPAAVASPAAERDPFIECSIFELGDQRSRELIGSMPAEALVEPCIVVAVIAHIDHIDPPAGRCSALRTHGAWRVKPDGDDDSSSRPRCAQCGVRRAEMKRCARCRSVHYCDERCQRRHWRTHRKTCVP